jgi:hypothetical protein
MKGQLTAPCSARGRRSIPKNAGHLFGLPGYEGLVRARPFESRAASCLQDAALLTLQHRTNLPNEPNKEPELPLLEAFVILLMLGLFLLLLFMGGLYWF